jgi:hypothetical protein
MDVDGGAYVTLAPVVLSRGASTRAGPTATARCASGARRGRKYAAERRVPLSGRRPSSRWARHMDAIAARLSGSAVLRHRNAIRLGDVTPTGRC